MKSITKYQKLCGSPQSTLLYIFKRIEILLDLHMHQDKGNLEQSVNRLTYGKKASNMQLIKIL